MSKGQLPRYFLEKGPGSRIRLCRPRDGCCSDSALLCALRVAVEDRHTCMAVPGSFLHREGGWGWAWELQLAVRLWEQEVDASVGLEGPA